MNKIILLAFIILSCNTISREYQTISEEYYKIAKLNEEMGNNSISLELYKKSIEFNRENNNVGTYNYVLACIELGNFLEATNKLDNLLNTDSNNILLINLKAYLELRQKNLDKSLDYYLKTLKEAPTNQEALFNIFYIYYLKEDKENARKYILKYRELKYAEPVAAKNIIDFVLSD